MGSEMCIRDSLLTMYDTVELSGGTNEGIRGGGLVDCDAATDKLLSLIHI